MWLQDGGGVKKRKKNSSSRRERRAKLTMYRWQRLRAVATEWRVFDKGLCVRARRHTSKNYNCLRDRHCTSILDTAQ